jgi:transposase
MIQLTAHMKILVAKETADFRKGVDGMVALCRQALGEDPFSGTVFVFRSRRGTMVRIVVYDGQGFWLMTKRLSKGRFPAWQPFDAESAHQLVQAHQLQLLLAGGSWQRCPVAEAWRPLAA